MDRAKVLRRRLYPLVPLRHLVVLKKNTGLVAQTVNRKNVREIAQRCRNIINSNGQAKSIVYSKG